MSEIYGAILAVWLFLLPASCIRAAMKDGIVGDFGVWFWGSVDGLRVCGRHLQRAISIEPAFVKLSRK